MNLSPHFTLEEATFSQVANAWGLENQPDAEQLARMRYTAIQMEKVRALLGNNAIRVNSWYRSPAVNAKVGGVPTSQHARKEAVDFTCIGFGSAKDIAKKIQKHKNDIGYDQLIYEQTWVHISFTPDRARKKDLTFLGKGKYVDGIV